MKRHTAQIYRILRILQTKGLLESTLEAPVRFKAIPFETVLDLSIKAKRNEAAQMEKTKDEIASYWRSIRQPEIEKALEKFVVIEGNTKIYPKIAQMIKETEKQLSATVTVPGLFRADQFGLFDAILTHPLRSEIAFRFLTDASAQNLSLVKNLPQKLPKIMFRFGAKGQEAGQPLSPRMVLRDREEALFFITPRNGASDAGKDEVVLWTDCRELVLAFAGTFEEMWQQESTTGRAIAAEISKTTQTLMIEDDKWDLGFSPSAKIPQKWYGSSSVTQMESKNNSSRTGNEQLPSIEYVREKWQHYAQTKEPIMAYGWRAYSVIRLSNLPKRPMIGVNVIHLDDNSAFGGGKMIEIRLWTETPNGSSLVPVACLVNTQGSMVMKHFYEGTPAEQNVVLVEPHKNVEVFRKDNLVFAGWTVNIPLPPLEYALGPSCLYFEGHGPVQQVTRTYSVPAGFKSTTEYKKCHAFVTFMNQSIPYFDSGNQGFLATEYIMRTTFG